ncbi:hypothetical protein [Curtobacterium flaccumfaciens]|nr:hypothetical protein [Curtobacterium flaccumfaciens]
MSTYRPHRHRPSAGVLTGADAAASFVGGAVIAVVSSLTLGPRR